MRAIAFDRVGGPDVLHEVDIPMPRPAAGQVLIRVAYAGVNFAEAYRRRGSGGPVREPTVPGLEVSGHVAALGPGVTGRVVGEAVAALTHPDAGASGGYAEYAVAPADTVIGLGEVDLTTGAALGCTVTSAYGLLAAADLAEGETLLLHGAAGAVGSMVAPLARHMGAGRVLGTVGSPDKRAAARDHGYDAVYLRDDFAEQVAAQYGPRSVHAVLDPVAGPARVASLGLLAPAGRLVVFGNAGDWPDVEVSTNQLWLTSIAVVGYSIGALAAGASRVVRAHLRRAWELVAAGRLTVPIVATLPLADAAEAHRRLDARASRGKMLLAVGA